MMSEIVGAYCTIRWNDPDPSEVSGNYFSFEDLPEGWDGDDNYVLPKSGMREDNVFYYCSESQLESMVRPEDKEADFTVLSIDEWKREVK